MNILGEKIMRRTIFLFSLFSLLHVVLFLSGCNQNDTSQSDQAETMKLQVWAHAGQEAERQLLKSQVARFNEQSKTTLVQLTFIPERDYNSQIQAAALADDLPDILEFDGPYLYNYIWQNHLIPLEDILPGQLIDDLLPSVVDQGSHGGHLYSVGVFDSGLGLYARKSTLQDIGARIPKGFQDAWSFEEFNAILQKLAAIDDDRAVLDLKLNYTGEWFTYGFSPILQSAGADLIDRKTYLSSTGVLNSQPAINAMQELQNWLKQGFVDPNLDDSAFLSGRVALSWVGHWEYPRYYEAHKEDLIVLPLPDFGRGSKTGQGSWNWGITRKSNNVDSAVEFIAFLLQTDEVLAMSNANGAVPGTKSAVSASPLYGKKGRLRLFADQLMSGASIPRPKTPAYPVITTQFQNAFQQIRNGADVKQALTRAAEKIDQDINDNKGYPFMTK